MKVSIVVPVYNVEAYLPKCLDSLINQTFNDYEIILINDGSTDNSLKIIDEYSQKYPDKIVKINKVNEGQAIARNVGIKQARGEYIMFVDSDDYIDKNTLKTCYDKAKENKADIVCFDYQLIDKDIPQHTENFRKMAKNNIKNYILNQTGPCFKLMKTQIIKDNHLYFPALRAYEDIAVVPAYALFTNNIINLDDKFYYYIFRSGSTMNQLVYSEKLEHIFPAMDNLFEIFCKQDKINTYHDELEFLFIQHLLHGAGLRFISFPNYQNNLNRIIKIMQDKFPKWKNNKYFKKQNIKYKIMCKLLYKNKVNLIKKLQK